MILTISNVVCCWCCLLFFLEIQLVIKAVPPHKSELKAVTHQGAKHSAASAEQVTVQAPAQAIHMIQQAAIKAAAAASQQNIHQIRVSSASTVKSEPKVTSPPQAYAVTARPHLQLSAAHSQRSPQNTQGNTQGMLNKAQTLLSLVTAGCIAIALNFWKELCVMWFSCLENGLHWSAWHLCYPTCTCIVFLPAESDKWSEDSLIMPRYSFHLSWRISYDKSVSIEYDLMSYVFVLMVIKAPIFIHRPGRLQ